MEELRAWPRGKAHLDVGWGAVSYALVLMITSNAGCMGELFSIGECIVEPARGHGPASQVLWQGLEAG